MSEAMSDGNCGDQHTGESLHSSELRDNSSENSTTAIQPIVEETPADKTTGAAPIVKSQTRADKIREKKAKRKEDKALETVMRNLAALKTPEDKLEALTRRYTELHEANQTLTLQAKQKERTAALTLREKEQLQVEHSKSLLAKNKLESLCRELQKYNREVKEESLSRARLEEEKRREIAASFQGSLSDIQEKMTANHETNNSLRKDNVDLQGKLKGLIEQYEKAQLTMDKVFERNKEMTLELERQQKEKENLMLELQQSYKKLELMHEQEKHLRVQLNTYTEKYAEFQTSLKNSNQVFKSFKGEMEKMTGKIKKLEKESLQWKKRSEEANKTLLSMAEEKTNNDKERRHLNLKNQRLEELCRALQQQRGTTPPDVKTTEKIQTQGEDSTDSPKSHKNCDIENPEPKQNGNPDEPKEDLETRQNGSHDDTNPNPETHHIGRPDNSNRATDGKHGLPKTETDTNDNLDTSVNEKDNAITVEHQVDSTIKDDVIRDKDMMSSDDDAKSSQTHNS